MAALWTCPDGHHWIPDGTDAAPSHPAAPVCPVCSAPGRLLEADAQTFMAIPQPPEPSSPSAPDAAAVTLPPPQGGPPPRAVPARSLPGYELFGELGRGGMGVVYKARHLALKRLVAVKMVLAGEFANPDNLLRFQAEAHAVARLQHPNIIQIYDIGTYDGQPFFTMEYVNGCNLGQKLSGAPQPAESAARTMEVLARTVQYAHQNGIIHRDLKPANVLIGQDGHLKVTDFGLAKQIHGATLGPRTASGYVVGTPEYMAPEQALAPDKVGVATDVYALGVILYEMLTGRRPFEGATPLQTLDMMLDNEPVSPSRLQARVPRDLTTICLKCLRKEPYRRYPSAAALADDLQRFLGGKPIEARPVSNAERVWKWARRHPSLAASLAAVVLLLVGIATVSTIDAGLLREHNRRADEAEAKHKLAQADELLRAAPETVPYLLDALKPVAAVVLPFLRERLTDPNETAARRLRAAIALTAFGEPQLDTLREGVVRAPEAECRNLALALRTAAGPSVVEQLLGNARTAPDLPQRVRWAILLLDLGDLRAAQALLGTIANPTARGALIETFPNWHGELAVLPDLLRRCTDAECRSTLCVAVGRVDPHTLSADVRVAMTEVLKDLYRQAPDGGTHSAAGWALRQWQETLPPIEGEREPSGERRWFVNRRGMTLVAVPPGAVEFGETCMVITRPVFMSDREVSVARFKQFLGDARPFEWPGPLRDICPSDDCPVHAVSREEMLQFCNWLSTKEGRQPCYQRVAGSWQCDIEADGYRLPTEAEWDHAHRAGALTRFFFANDTQWAGSYAHVGAVQLLPCGSKQPNRWGLFDMVGNTWEMCWDVNRSRLPRGVEFDPTGPREGSPWVVRGGAYDSGSYDYRATHRLHGGPERHASRGFRVVCGAPTANPVGPRTPAEETQRRIDRLAEAIAAVPDNPRLYRLRCDLLVRLGRWPEAAADLARAVELAPGDHTNANQCASLLAMAGDAPAYRRHCRLMLNRFGTTSDPMIAERTAKACLLVADAVDDLAPILALSDRAVAAGPAHWIIKYAELARGMADYRAGQFESALEWLRKSQAPSNTTLSVQARALAVLFESMTLCRLGQAEAGAQAFEKARGLLRKELEMLERGVDVDGWHDVLMNGVVFREARALFQSQP